MGKTLQELCDLVGGTLVGDPSYVIEGVEEIACAQKQHITFLENARYQKFLSSCQAGAIILHPALLPKTDQLCHYLVHEHPSSVFQKMIEIFLKEPVSGFTGIHPTAVIHSTAVLDPSVTVGPYVVIDAHVKVGAHTSLAARVYLGPEVQVGENCCLHPGVVIEAGSCLGHRVVIQAGAVIGSDGFGYYTDKQGKHHALKQLGHVVIEDDVEIGANTTVDRARFKNTRIGRGTKVDNLVQIGHQVELGEDNLIVAQAGIAGSTKTGRHVVMGGQVGVAGHITLADGVILTARCAVSKSLDQAGTYYGAPAQEESEFKKHFFALRKMGRMMERFQKLEKHFAHLLEDVEETTST